MRPPLLSVVVRRLVLVIVGVAGLEMMGMVPVQ